MAFGSDSTQLTDSYKGEMQWCDKELVAWHSFGNNIT